MSGLNSLLGIGTGALSAAEAAMQVTENNISNASTDGYTRQIVDLTEAAPTQENGIEIGDGVNFLGVSSTRNQMLDLMINQQTSAASSASASGTMLNSLETYFPTASTSGADVGSSLSAFFTSLSALSSSPSSTTSRQTAMSRAQDLVNAFHTTSA